MTNDGEQHWCNVEDWPINRFTPKEIACKATGLIIVDVDALVRLEIFRGIAGVPFSPNSAYRSKEHNEAVGGAKNSYHRKGVAFDIPIKGDMTREVIHHVAGIVGFEGIGDYDNFVHVDTGPKRYWDNRT